VKRSRIAAAALLVVSLSIALARGAEVAGVALDDRVTVTGAPLVLNGAGLRTRFLLEVYVIGLYVRARTTNADAVLAAKPVQSDLKQALLGG
jgi:hypothetical protein